MDMNQFATVDYSLAENAGMKRKSDVMQVLVMLKN